MAFGGFLIGTLRCFDSCLDQRGASWYYSESAWQWDAIMSLGFLQLGLAVVLCVFVVARRRAMSFALLGLQTLCAGALALLVAGAAMGDVSDNVFAIALAPGRARGAGCLGHPLPGA